MVVLVVLLSVFFVSWGILWITGRSNRVRTAGCIAFAALFIFTGVSHFSLADGMVWMLPKWIPNRYPIIYITGIMEIVMGIGFLFSSTRRITGIMAIAFLICVLPSNIYASLNSVDFGGNVQGARYLLFRIPLQLFLIWWVGFMAVRR
ncbi:DoxX family protein [Myxosarcina sp. GI1(2024)]